jgi:hypothetical protein
VVLSDATDLAVPCRDCERSCDADVGVDDRSVAEGHGAAVDEVSAAGFDRHNAMTYPSWVQRCSRELTCLIIKRKGIVKYIKRIRIPYCVTRISNNINFSTEQRFNNISQLFKCLDPVLDWRHLFCCENVNFTTSFLQVKISSQLVTRYSTESINFLENTSYYKSDWVKMKI